MTGWLEKRAREIQQERQVWTRECDAEDMELIRNMAIQLAREFAERALQASKKTGVHFPGTPAKAIAEADKDDTP